MISFIKGKILNKVADTMIILTESGLGYSVCCTSKLLFELNEGDKVELFTYMKVSENSNELFGFETLEDKGFFELLLSVKGIGPRGAINILALGSIKQTKNAIANGDIAYLTQVSGIGKRTAERMVVEMKSKIRSSGHDGEYGVSQSGDMLSEVISGLVAMGYTKEEAKASASGLNTEDKTIEELLKEALKQK